MRSDRVLQRRVDPEHRLQDTGPRPLAPGPCGSTPEHHTGGRRDDLIPHGHRSEDFEDHNVSNHTPEATSPAPAQRRQSTRSFRTKRASTVSMATVAAETGTAKLKSAVSSSVIKAKKETAMKKIARIRNFFLASVARSRPSPRGSKS